MKWVNIRVDCLDGEGVMAASLTGDIPFVYHSLQASYNNKALPRMAFESLIKGDIRISYVQACTDKTVDFDSNIQDYSISASDFVEKISVCKFVATLKKLLFVSFAGKFDIRPYYVRYIDEKVLKEYSESE